MGAVNTRKSGALRSFCALSLLFALGCGADGAPASGSRGKSSNRSGHPAQDTAHESDDASGADEDEALGERAPADSHNTAGDDGDTLGDGTLVESTPEEGLIEGGLSEDNLLEDGAVNYRMSAAIHQYTSPTLALGDPWLNVNSAALGFCGDGARALTSTEEECDSGAAPSAACSASCRVKDFLAAGTDVAKDLRRELGGSVHPIAGSPMAPGGLSAGAVTWHEVGTTPKVMLQILDRHGNRLGTNTSSVDGRYAATASANAGLIQINPSPGNVPTSFASPVVAPVYPAVPTGGSSLIDPRQASYVVAWNELGGEGSDLGVAFRRVSIDARSGIPSIVLGDVQHPSAGAVWGQQDPDLITLPNGNVILAWTDMRSPVTAPDIRFRAFSANLADIGEFSLTATSAIESAISLATVPGDAGGFFYAYREARPDGGETIVVGRRTGVDLETRQTVRYDVPLVGSSLVQGPGPEGERPALVGLDTHRALVVFPIGTDPNNTGTSQVFRLWGVVVDVSTGQVLGTTAINPMVSPYSTETTLSLTHPVLVEAGTDGLFLAWRSSSIVGNASAEELWLKNLHWSPVATGTGLTLTVSEVPLPREASHQPGDQRSPGMAVLSYPGGIRALGLAWEDWGATFGGNAAKPDIALEIVPLTQARLAAIEQNCTSTAKCAAGKGPCSANNQCTTGLCSLGTTRGPKYGYGPSQGVCETTSCASTCGGTCGKCFTCPSPTAYGGTAHYCSAVCPCATKKGDCDDKLDCQGTLVCAADAGPQVNLNSSTDLCLPVTCTNTTQEADETRLNCGGTNCAPCQIGTANFCSETTRCTEGQGHCDSDAECASGLTCVADQGPLYGFASSVKVCVPSACVATASRGKPGDAQFCSSSCRCADGVGACDPATGSAQCIGTLDSNGSTITATKCTVGRGRTYGAASETAMCVPSHCFDGEANADESQVDCGGSCGNFCPRCGGGTASIRNFHLAADWSRPKYALTGGAAPTIAVSTTATSGPTSLSFTGSKYDEYWSRDFTVDEFDAVGSKIYVDVRHLVTGTAPAANTWIGSAELRVVFENAKTSVLIPTRDFLQGANPSWVTLEGTLDTALQTALRSSLDKFKLELRINRPFATETLVDNLRFGGESTPVTNCYSGSGSVSGPAVVTMVASATSVPSLLDFEVLGDWQTLPGGAVLDGVDVTSGTKSLAVTQAAGTTVGVSSKSFGSAALGAVGLGVTQALTLDVKTPAPAAGQTLSGSIRLIMACPTGNLWWSDTVSIAELPENQWTRARFKFPRALKANLATATTCAFRLESSLSGQVANSAIRYDSLRFESDTPCTTYTQTNAAPFLSMPGPPNGSAKKPYPICNSAQLSAVRNDAGLRDKHYILMQDLDLAGWNNMISAPSATFRGTFDGQGRTVRNHTYSTSAYVGLFGWLEGDATVDGNLDGMVRNLRVENSNVSGSYRVGALAGYAGSARIHNVVSTNARATGTQDSIGGLVGTADAGTRIVDSSALGVQVVAGGVGWAGGLVGDFSGTIKNCRSEGSVSVVGTGGTTGGLIGNVASGSDISGSSSSAAVITQGGWVGGLVGSLVGTVSKSSATGSVTGGGAVGGLVGRASGQITDCRASGPVSGRMNDWGTGGLVGQGSDLTITRSSATGAVTYDGGGCGGGLVGWLARNTTATSITDSYASGSVSAYSGVGGLVGCLQDSTVTRAHSTGTVQFVGTQYPSGAFIGWRGGVNTFVASVVRNPSNPTLPVVGYGATPAGISRFAVSLFESSTAFAGLNWDITSSTSIWVMGPKGPELR